MRPYRCRLLWSFVGPLLLFFVGLSRESAAETVVYNPWNGAFYWWGEHNGNQIGNLLGNNYPGNPVDGIPTTGNGGVADWSRNWFGRYQATGDESCQSGCQPATFMGLPPQAGDVLYFKENFISEDGPYNIGGGSVSIPSGSVSFEIDATFGGGSFDVENIFVTTSGNWGNSVTFSGTTLKAPNVSIFGSNITRPSQTTINLNSTFVDATGGKLDIIGGSADNPWKLNVTASLLFADTINIGPESLLYGTDTAIDFTGDTASFIGAELTTVAAHEDAIVHLNIHSPTPNWTPDSPIHIGDRGQAYVKIDNQGSFNTAITSLAIADGSFANVELDNGTWTTRDAFIGMLGTATIKADNNSILTSQDVTIGVLASSKERTVTLDHDSTWTISGKLQVGKENSGTLNISHDSKVEVTQDMTVGVTDESHGVVEVSDGGELKLSANSYLRVGREEGSSGKLTFAGSQSKFSGGTALVNGVQIGVAGYGTLTLREGFQLKNEDSQGEGSPFTLGWESTGTGILEVDGEGTLFKAGDVTVGDSGTGEISVFAGGKVQIDGNGVLGMKPNSHGTLNIFDSLGASNSSMAQRSRSARKEPAN